MTSAVEFSDTYIFFFLGTRMTLYALNMLPDGRFLSSELATAVIPFRFHGRNQFKSIFRLMAILHVCANVLFFQNTHLVAVPLL
jgi:hypothetical protein